jgi:hypothetical protein
MRKARNDGKFAVGLRRTVENTTPTSVAEFAGLSVSNCPAVEATAA